MSAWLRHSELLRLPGRFDEAVAVLRALPLGGHSKVRAVGNEKLVRGGEAQVPMPGASLW